MRILIFDIESAPHMAYVWGFWQQNISASQVLKNRTIMSVAYKWLGDDTVYYIESRKGSDKKLIKNIVKVLDEADIVIAHNARKFDLGVVNARAVAHNISPPSPYKVIDTLLEARKHFKFDSNSLEFLANYLNCTPKLKHKNFPGFELWLQCLAQNDKAWEELQEYNIQDVLTLEEVYIKLRPWMTTHPNVAALLENGVETCPKCGGTHLHKRGYTTTSVGKYARFQCQDCGGWGRSRTNVYDKAKKQALLTNAG